MTIIQRKKCDNLIADIEMLKQEGIHIKVMLRNSNETGEVIGGEASLVYYPASSPGDFVVAILDEIML